MARGKAKLAVVETAPETFADLVRALPEAEPEPETEPVPAGLTATVAALTRAANLDHRHHEAAALNRLGICVGEIASALACANDASPDVREAAGRTLATL